MTKLKKNKKARRRAYANAVLPKSKSTLDFYKHHREQHPNCTYGAKPHFVPPSFGEIGFYMCDPPADIRNHTRCEAPFDHEHPDHFGMSDSYMVTDMADTLGLDTRPFGKFGPFATIADAEAFIERHPHSDKLRVANSKECR